MARWTTVVAVVTLYVALQLAINAGLDLQARDRFREAPDQAAAFVAALDHYADGDASARAGITAGNAWFAMNAPPAGESRPTVAAAAEEAEAGRVAPARQRVASLSAQVAHDQASLSRQFTSSALDALWWLVAAEALLAPALWLRRRRRAGAAEMARIVSRFAPNHPWWRRPLFLTANGFGSGLFAAGFYAYSAFTHQGASPMPVVVQMLLLPLGLGSLAAGFFLLRYTRPRAARDAARALLSDGRRPVLYLRSFKPADEDMAEVDDVVAVNIHSREEQLAASLSAFGPVIAVGDPEESLPRLGAARFYLPTDDWKPAVRQLMDLSQLIVLHLGLGDGLWWEVEQARSTQPPRKLILLVPKDREDLAPRLDVLLPTPTRLDEVTAGQSWISAVVSFDAEWNPQVHPVHRPPRESPRRSWLARLPSRSKSAFLATMTTFTPVHLVARAVKTALASNGIRRRGMVARGDYAAQAVLWKGIELVTGLGLLVWLVVRVLQLFGLS
ncbi:transferase [Streptacidiphilus sp. MAP5-3]|uniref:transferase n=1 Tax=unclassified Streptacidiphilus TaxID=2643834 RepID=UPI003512DD68